eukprot:scaffold68609_cov36-Phaeocystis_antarctica.AAC.1
MVGDVVGSKGVSSVGGDGGGVGHVDVNFTLPCPAVIGRCGHLVSLQWSPWYVARLGGADCNVFRTRLCLRW